VIAITCGKLIATGRDQGAPPLVWRPEIKAYAEFGFFKEPLAVGCSHQQATEAFLVGSNKPRHLMTDLLSNLPSFISRVRCGFGAGHFRQPRTLRFRPILMTTLTALLVGVPPSSALDRI
jgi:hypothetical protein